MPCEVAVMNKRGMAVAADSAVALENGKKIYRTGWINRRGLATVKNNLELLLISVNKSLRDNFSVSFLSNQTIKSSSSSGKSVAELLYRRRSARSVNAASRYSLALR
jgi:hypothetical protein